MADAQFLRRLAVVILVLGAVVPAFDVFPDEPTIPPAEGQEPQEQQASGPALPAPSEEQPPQAAYQQAACDDPTSYDDADLCLQARMADAAEKQTWIIAAEGVLLVITLALTAVATFAATRATKVAAQAFEHSAALDRPWIYVEVMRSLRGIDPKFATKDDTGGFVEFVIRNHGRVPAAITQWNEVASYGKDPETGLNDESRVVSIGPDGAAGPFHVNSEIPTGNIEIEKIGGSFASFPEKRAGERLFFRVEAEYRSAIGRQYECGFCWVFDHALSAWRPHYGVPADKYNYDREKKG